MPQRRQQVVPPHSHPLIRIMANVVIDANMCFVWQGATRNGAGNGRQYGRITHEGRGWFTHILAFVSARGPVPDGLVLDHTCRNTLCCNPLHLEPVTQQINVLRGDGIAAKNATKTHCRNGHPFSEENTYHYLSRGKPARACRICGRATATRWANRNRRLGGRRHGTRV